MREQLMAVTRRKIWFVAVFAALFALVDVLAQLPDGVSWWRPLVALLGSAAVTWILFALVDWRAGKARDADSSERNAPARPWLLSSAAFAVPVLAWIPMFLHYWPMASMNDTLWILRDPIGASVQHPMTYNVYIRTIVSVGEKLGGSPVAGVVFAAIVQMVLWGIALALVVRYLETVGARRGALWVLIVYFAVFPLIGDYSFALTKDSIFALFMVLLIPVLLIIRSSGGRALADSLFFVVATLVLVGFAVTRNNGLPALVLLAPLVLVYATRARMRSLVFVAVALALAFVPLRMTSLMAGPQKFQEAVGVPLQMAGGAIAQGGECLPESSAEYFDQVLPRDEWAAAYNPRSIDPIKDHAAFDAKFLSEHRGEFVSQWGRAALACPAEFGVAYLAHTSQVWRFDADPVGLTGQSMFTSVVTNHPANRDKLIAEYAAKGIENQSLLPAPLANTLGAFYDAGMKWTPGAGTWMWAMLLTIAGFAYRRRHEWLAIYAPTMLVWASLLAGAPTTSPFRYVEFMILAVPVGLVVLLATPPLATSRATTSVSAQPTSHS